MRSYIVLIAIFCNFCLYGQITPCYFQKDVGTTAVETAYSAVELSDGTIYVTGIQANGPNGNDDIALLKFDACGNLLWTRYYGDTLSNDGYGINKTADEKLILVGQTATPNNGSDAYLYIADTSGNLLMQKLYGGPLSEMGKYIEQTSDKGFVFCGYQTDSNGSNDSYVVKVDSAGAVQWQIALGGPYMEYADQVHELADGNFLFTGDTKSFGSGATDVEVTKTDKNGNIIWDRYYGDHLDNGCQGILVLSNGNYLSYGETNITGSVAFDFFIETLDTAGNSISRHTFGGNAADALFSLAEMPGMDLICTGYSRSFNGGAAYDIVLFRTDTAGNMKWLKNIYSPGVDIGYKLIPSMYGDYIITGLFDLNNGNYFLTRTDTFPNTSVGVKTSKTLNDIQIVPNPATSHALLTFPNGTTDVRLCSVTGELIREEKLIGSSKRLDVSALPNGAYLLFIGNNSGPPIVKKLLVNH